MNPNDLPPAARLAALIEAGRAANPDIKHGIGHYFHPTEHQACAIGFAAMAKTGSRNPYAVSNGAMKIEDEFGNTMRFHIVKMNDGGATIEEICRSLREGELATVAA